jgi:hypothetical protein
MTNFTEFEIIADDQLTDVKGGSGGKVSTLDIDGL